MCDDKIELIYVQLKSIFVSFMAVLQLQALVGFKHQRTLQILTVPPTNAQFHYCVFHC